MNSSFNTHYTFTFVTKIFSKPRADHDDQDVVMFNRIMLPSYYGLLRMCCQQSRTFTRQLAQHQNIQWAFKNISCHPAQYTAVSVLLWILLFSWCHQNMLIVIWLWIKRTGNKLPFLYESLLLVKHGQVIDICTMTQTYMYLLLYQISRDFYYSKVLGL